MRLPVGESRSTFLRIENLSIHFGGVKALNDCSFEVREGEIFSLIGPNGAGKTTVFNIINGLYKADEGRVHFRGEDLLRMKPHEVAHMGVARTFQNIELFSQMTVLENILIGQHIHLKSGFVSSAVAPARVRREERGALLKAGEIFKFLHLEQYQDELVPDLPYGIQKKIELARSLAVEPKLLLLDEPACGLNPNETKDLMELIERIRSDLRITILLVEHDMQVVMELSDRICVLHFGERIAEGTPVEIQNHPGVIEAYLGEKREYA